MLTTRDRNRTLLLRQHLLERTTAPALELVDHLVGLQAQEGLPPYLSLAARTDGFDPAGLSGALERGETVRFLTLRGTIHVLTVADALALRPWVQPALDRQSAGNQTSRPAHDVRAADLVDACRRLLADGPMPVAELGGGLAEAFPGVPARALAHRARELAPLVQVPPRGLWRRSGGVVYQTVENHLGRATTSVDVAELVRRYLRAFGPARPADMTTWSRVTRLGHVFESMSDELEVVECEDGRVRYDVPGAPYADGTAHAPVRLLGGYDNVWLSHADRSHIVPDDGRARWQGRNGAVGNTVFVDGFMAGLWWWRGGHVELDVAGRLSRRQRQELDDEVARIEHLLAG